MLIWDVTLSDRHHVRIVRSETGKIHVGLYSPGTLHGHARLTDADIDALAALLTHGKKEVNTGKKRRSTLPSIGR